MGIARVGDNDFPSRELLRIGAAHRQAHGSGSLNAHSSAAAGIACRPRPSRPRRAAPPRRPPRRANQRRGRRSARHHQARPQYGWDLARSAELSGKLAALVGRFERDAYRLEALLAHVTQEESRKRWAALAAFHKANGHFLVTNGPYRLKQWSEDKVTVEAFRDLSYPLGVGSYNSYARCSFPIRGARTCASSLNLTKPPKSTTAGPRSRPRCGPRRGVERRHHADFRPADDDRNGRASRSTPRSPASCICPGAVARGRSACG